MRIKTPPGREGRGEQITPADVSLFPPQADAPERRTRVLRRTDPSLCGVLLVVVSSQRAYLGVWVLWLFVKG